MKDKNFFIKTLKNKIENKLKKDIDSIFISEFNELNLYLQSANLIKVMLSLKKDFNFEQLIDISGIDYLYYGKDEWKTKNCTNEGFSRAVVKIKKNKDEIRFGISYHLLSLKLNVRIRVKILLQSNLKIPSITKIWTSANWNEREAFDMFGFIFEGHPDLRRILTDNNFIGYPLRKDFPQTGNLEIRYDEEKKSIVYEEITIKNKINIPKVIRKSKITS